MKYSDIKQIRNFCYDLPSAPDWREVVGNIRNGVVDFIVNNVRFINSDDIDKIQQLELSKDEYTLGCFNAQFISECIEIDLDVILSMQKAGAFEAVGKLIISLEKLEELQEEYSREEGYGYHFNQYDHKTEEIEIDGAKYYVFDNHTA